MEISVKLEGFTESELQDKVVRGLVEGLRYKLEAVLHAMVAEVIGNEFKNQLRIAAKEILAGGAAVPARDPETEEWTHVTVQEFMDRYMRGKIRYGYRDHDRLGQSVERAVDSILPDLLKDFIAENSEKIRETAAAELGVKMLERFMR